MPVVAATRTSAFPAVYAPQTADSPINYLPSDLLPSHRFDAIYAMSEKADLVW
jgi:hypothetical protein